MENIDIFSCIGAFIGGALAFHWGFLKGKKIGKNEAMDSCAEADAYFLTHMRPDLQDEYMNARMEAADKLREIVRKAKAKNG